MNLSLRWALIFVKEGDKIKKGQNLLELHLIEPKEQVLKQPLYFTITNHQVKKVGLLS